MSSQLGLVLLLWEGTSAISVGNSRKIISVVCRHLLLDLQRKSRKLPRTNVESVV
jgi:hypothetical protein